MKKTVKEWAGINKFGGVIFVRLTKQSAEIDQFTYYGVTDIVPCTITYTIPKRRKKC